MLYFDVFNYPLTVDELFENTAVMISKAEFSAELALLLNRAHLKRSGDFILSPGASAADIDKRLNGNKGASSIMSTAYAYSKKIGSFPFVEGICLSGALSKNYYDAHGDIDYFILAKPGRLWICRTLLIIRYKLLPPRLKKFWCVNYFISSDHLAIADQNAFTATELAYLVPSVNMSLYKDLLQHNSWYKDHFPNKPESTGAHCIEAPRPLFKSFFENIFSGGFGNKADDLLLKMTLKNWRKKFPAMSEEDFELQFRSRKHVCKRHTHGYQNKALKTWEERLRNFEQQFKLSLQG